MKRTNIINKLVEKNGYEKYLEIGVRSGVNFRPIKCPYKIGVDPDKSARATHFMTSDEFFEENKDIFDIIFIDGDHEEEQVLKDFDNALKALSPDGAIVMHDCNPINEWRQRPKEEFDGLAMWNGTVWRAYVRLRQREDLSMCVVDTDEGTAVIQRGSQIPLKYNEPLEYKELEERREEMLNLISPKEWLKSMNGNIDVVLIKYCPNNQDEEAWNKTYAYLQSKGVNVLTRDNTNDNIGLVKARMELIEKSEAEYICFMDFDFNSIDIDFEAMKDKLRGDVAIAIPDSGCSWGMRDGIPCNCIFMKRRIYESLGGYDPRYFIAYADWDLVTKVWNAGLKVERVKGSKLSHQGASEKNPQKRQLWNKDRDAYVEKWCKTYKGKGGGRVLVSNPDGKDVNVELLTEAFGQVDVFSGVHDMNFWFSVLGHYQDVYHIPSIYLDNTNIVKASQFSGMEINLVLNNSAIVVIVCRNIEKFVGECIDSVTSQTWKDVGIVFVDDSSDDNTIQIAMQKLTDRTSNICIKNKSRQWAMHNIDYAITNFCLNPDSVIFLVDGDDKLNTPTAIEEMMKQHEDHDLVWSSYVTSQSGVPSCCGPIDESKPIRKQQWRMSHLRSFKKFLFDAIDKEEFKENGEYLKMTWDRAIMCPLAEMTPPEKRKHYPAPLYWYRFHGGNDHVVDRAEQVRVEKVIHSRPPAPLLERYVKKKSVT
jgi:glycosyltransferase involved in cell wall biosynthesis